jgi:demethylmenaquinone methyltransferase/2-methoxy-6-polyprenyl-1,4-benzoquinol methylase
VNFEFIYDSQDSCGKLTNFIPFSISKTFYTIFDNTYFNTHRATISYGILVTAGHLIATRFFSSSNASSYDKIVRLTTFYRDSSWKKEMMRFMVGKNELVLDLACGTGILSSFIHNGSASAKIFGTDLTYEYLKLAKNRQSYALLTNSIAEFLPYKNESFDAIVSSYLVKYAELSTMVREHWRVLRKGGIIIIHDFTYPNTRIMKVLWHFYFQILNELGKVIRPWKDVFSNLDKLIQQNSWVNNLIRELNTVGFTSISKKYYTYGTSAIVYARK